MSSFYDRLQRVALLPLAFLMWSGAADHVLGWSDPLVDLLAFHEGAPIASFFVLCALAIEIIGPLALLIRRCRAAAALVLAAYTMTAAFLFHDFWRVDDFAHSQLQDFLRNLALAGALLFIFTASRGRDLVGSSPTVLDGADLISRPRRPSTTPPPIVRTTVLAQDGRANWKQSRLLKLRADGTREDDDNVESRLVSAGSVPSEAVHEDPAGSGQAIDAPLHRSVTHGAGGTA